MKRIYQFFILICAIFGSFGSSYGQVIKPDYVRTPNGPNTIVDWNVKFKTLIIPHYSLENRPTSQDTIGQFFFNTDSTDQHIYFNGVDLNYHALANLSDLYNYALDSLTYSTYETDSLLNLYAKLSAQNTFPLIQLFTQGTDVGYEGAYYFENSANGAALGVKAVNPESNATLWIPGISSAGDSVALASRLTAYQSYVAGNYARTTSILIPTSGLQSIAPDSIGLGGTLTQIANIYTHNNEFQLGDIDNNTAYFDVDMVNKNVYLQSADNTGNQSTYSIYPSNQGLQSNSSYGTAYLTLDGGTDGNPQNILLDIGGSFGSNELQLTNIGIVSTISGSFGERQLSMLDTSIMIFNSDNKPISYTSHPNFYGKQQIPDVQYVDSLLTGCVPYSGAIGNVNLGSYYITSDGYYLANGELLNETADIDLISGLRNGVNIRGTLGTVIASFNDNNSVADDPGINFHYNVGLGTNSISAATFIGNLQTVTNGSGTISMFGNVINAAASLVLEAGNTYSVNVYNPLVVEIGTTGNDQIEINNNAIIFGTNGVANESLTLNAPTTNNNDVQAFQDKSGNIATTNDNVSEFTNDADYVTSSTGASSFLTLAGSNQTVTQSPTFSNYVTVTGIIKSPNFETPDYTYNGYTVSAYVQSGAIVLNDITDGYTIGLTSAYNGKPPFISWDLPLSQFANLKIDNVTTSQIWQLPNESGTLLTNNDLSGYLTSSTAESTYQPIGNYITALTGDGTASGPGPATFTLATVNSNVGTFNNITVNAKGLVTAASNVGYQSPLTFSTGLINTSGIITFDPTQNYAFTGNDSFSKLITDAAGTNSGTTPTDALLLTTTTPATSSIPQYSGDLNFQSNSYNTTTATSQRTNWKIYNAAINGTAATSQLNFDYASNGSSYTTFLHLTAGGSFSLVGSIITTKSAFATTSTDGIVLENQSTGTSSIPVQYSPRLHFSGTAYNTTSSIANTLDAINELRPVSGSTTSSALYWSFDNNGGTSYVDAMALNSNGSLFINGRLGLNSGTSSSSTISAWLEIAANSIYTTSSAYSTLGFGLQVAASTFNSSAAAGSTTTAGINTFGIPTIEALNAQTITNFATVYIDGAPVASSAGGGTVTVTNPYALYVNSGNVYSGGEVIATGGIQTNSNGLISNLYVPSSGLASGAVTQASWLFGGATSVSARVVMAGASTSTLGSSASYSSLLVASSPIGTASTGTDAWINNATISPLGTITNNGATVTNTATLYLGGVSAAGTNNYLLYGASGNSYLGGALSLTHLIGNTPVPTIAAGTAAGTSPAVTISGTDLSGDITITTGTSTTTGVLATLTFSSAYGNAPHPIISPANANAAALSGTQNVYSTSTTSTLVINSGSTAISASTTYVFHYTLIQ